MLLLPLGCVVVMLPHFKVDSCGQLWTALTYLIENAFQVCIGSVQGARGHLE